MAVASSLRGAHKTQICPHISVAEAMIASSNGLFGADLRKTDDHLLKSRPWQNKGMTRMLDDDTTDSATAHPDGPFDHNKYCSTYCMCG
jgi:hypothetical protein